MSSVYGRLRDLGDGTMDKAMEGTLNLHPLIVRCALFVKTHGTLFATTGDAEWVANRSIGSVR